MCGSSLADNTRFTVLIGSIVTVSEYPAQTELRERIDQYFDFCATKGFRPGIETLCLALGGISRQSFLFRVSPSVTIPLNYQLLPCILLAAVRLADYLENCCFSL